MMVRYTGENAEHGVPRVDTSKWVSEGAQVAVKPLVDNAVGSKTLP
jgi:hypothetical protein